MTTAGALLLLFAANPYLQEGQAHFSAQRFEAAAAKLELAVKVPTQSDDERQAALDLLARCQLAMGKESAALDTYRELLTAFPHSGGPGEQASPKIRSAFTRVKQALYPPGFCRLKRLASPDGTLAVEVTDPWGAVAVLRVKQRTGAEALAEVRVEPKDHVASVQLAPATRSADVEAVDAAGQPLATLGPLAFGALAPVERPVEAAVTAPPPRVERGAAWPAYGLIGLGFAAAAGGALSTVLGFGDARAAQTEVLATRTDQLNRSAHDRVILGYALFAGAGALALSGLLWWFLR